MQVEFRGVDLDRLETDPEFTGGYPREVIEVCRRRMQAIRDAVDERDLHVFRSWRFKKLQGVRSRQRSIRLNRKGRLVVEIRKASPTNVMVIVSIEG